MDSRANAKVLILVVFVVSNCDPLASDVSSGLPHRLGTSAQSNSSLSRQSLGMRCDVC